MNKEELIKKLGYARYSDTNDERYNYYNKGIDTAISLASKLDEPERPVVPQFVADWYEEHAGTDFEYNLYLLYIDYYEQKLEGDLKEWIAKGSKNKAIQTLVNMHQFGYEVQKKEKLYTAQLKSTGEFLHYDKETDKVHHFCAYGNTARNSKNYHFTEDTLIQYNAWRNDAYDVNEVEE